VLTQYENGYFQGVEFQHISAEFINTIKEAIRSIYDHKYQFIREPDEITRKDEEEPILKEIYD
jgi:acyl-[acyl carrier protein]--UDP-N-acetylglucosamine O-acyltransferase